LWRSYDTEGKVTSFAPCPLAPPDLHLFYCWKLNSSLTSWLVVALIYGVPVVTVHKGVGGQVEYVARTADPVLKWIPVDVEFLKQIYS